MFLLPNGLRVKFSPVFAICASLVLMLAVVGTSMVLFAHSQDADQIVSEQTIVDSAIRDAMAKLGDALRPNAYWDDAYDHVTDRIDADWAAQNLGPYARDTSGVSALFAVSQSGAFLYRYVGTEPERDALKYQDNPAVRQLIARAQKGAGVPPPIATGFVRIGDHIYLGAASRIVPNDERGSRPLPRNNVEVYLQTFGAARIAKVQRDFNVGAVSLSVQPPPPGHASLRLRDAAGAPIGFLWWKPATPGRAFALSIAPFALFMAVLIGILLSLTLRRWGETLLELERQNSEAALLRQECHARKVFIGTISHELRTPLNAILGFSGIMRDKVFGQLGSPRYDEYAGHIHRSGEMLLTCVNDVIEMSRIEGGDKVFECEAVDVQMVVRDALLRVAEKAGARKVELALEPRGESLVAVTNMRALHDIIVRVLDNAVKFSPEGGTVEIETRAGEQVMVIIRDHGIGIEKDILNWLGKPFFQVEDHLRRKYAGLGLGLAISYAMARQLGIEIAIESVPDRGTTVTISLAAAGITASHKRIAA